MKNLTNTQLLTITALLIVTIVAVAFLVNSGKMSPDTLKLLVVAIAGWLIPNPTQLLNRKEPQ